MTTATVPLLVRRYVADYARNPVNMLLLVVVPVAFVGLSAPSLAAAAQLLGGTAGPQMEANTAGWAAAALTGLAAYFAVAGARDVDRRLVLAGLSAGRVVASRIGSGLLLAAIASASALLALLVRTGVDDPVRVVGGTVMYAIVYLAVGAVLGTLVRDQVVGSVVFLFVFILDVFLGPTMVESVSVLTRAMPTHFVALVMVGERSGHAGSVGDLGWALAWTFGGLALAVLVFVGLVRRGRPRRAGRRGTARDRVWTALRLGLLESRRHGVLWALLVLVPAVFVLLSVAVTPDEPGPVRLIEGGRAFVAALPLVDVHSATMSLMALASLAGVASLFIVVGSAAGDRRLVLAGCSAREILVARVGVVIAAVLLATAVAVAVTAKDFTPRQWLPFVGGNLLVALSYGLLAALVGPAVGRISGMFLLFLLPYLDGGIAQSPMVRMEPATWAQFLPGYGPMRITLDGAFTDGFDAWGPLAASLAWLVALAAAAMLAYRRSAGLARGEAGRHRLRLRR